MSCCCHLISKDNLKWHTRNEREKENERKNELHKNNNNSKTRIYLNSNNMHHRLNNIPYRAHEKDAFLFSSSRHFKYLCIHFDSICLLLTHRASQCCGFVFGLFFFPPISISMKEKQNKTKKQTHTILKHHPIHT